MRRLIPVTVLVLVLCLGSPLGLGHPLPALAAGACSVPSMSYPTIASALGDSSCTSISLAAGTFHEHGLTVTRNLTISGAGFRYTVVDGGAAGTGVFTVNSGVTAEIDNLQVINGASTSDSTGGAISNHGSLTLKNDAFRQDVFSGPSSGGGAVFSDGSQLTVVGGVFNGDSYSATSPGYPSGGGAIGIYGGI